MSTVKVVQSNQELSDVISQLDSFVVGDQIVFKGDLYSYAKHYYMVLRISTEKGIEKFLVAGSIGAAVLGPIGWAGLAAVGGLTLTFLGSNYEKKIEAMQPEEILKLFAANFRMVKNSNGAFTLQKEDPQEITELLSKDWGELWTLAKDRSSRLF